MFYSPHALADSSSGAAMSVRDILGHLVKLGHQCLIVTGSLIDAPNELMVRATSVPVANILTVSGTNIEAPVRRLRVQGVTYVLLSLPPRPIVEYRAVEELTLQSLFLDCFRQFQPDALLTYGGFPSNYMA